MTPNNEYIELVRTRRGVERPFVKGTRTKVQYIVTDYEVHGLTAEEIAQSYENLTIAQVHAALAYYFDHREEVRGWMREDEQFVRRMQSTTSGNSLPGIITTEVRGTDAGNSTISSG